MGHPYIQAVVVMLDPTTGRPLAILDGRYLTALRTAAAIALAARHLCRPDSRVLGILGTGLQARTHLLCHLVVHPFERVVLWGRNAERVQAYLQEMEPQVKRPITPLNSTEAVCAEADVISCATRARNPLFAARAVRPGTHIGVAGPLRSEGTEIPLDLVRRGFLFVDSRKKFSQLWEAGTVPSVTAELGEVIMGKAVGRRSMDAVTIFKPVGMAFEDIVSARVVMERAEREGLGQVVAW
jgi:ornithine cyclodeaminase/alanine dehydrogenase-like protein (mu-crystallin family)